MVLAEKNNVYVSFMIPGALATSFASVLLENIQDSYLQVYAIREAILWLDARKYQLFVDAVGMLEVQHQNIV